jgi:hypothetical protein
LLVKPGSVNVNTQNIEALYKGDDYIQLDIMRDDRLQISQLGNYSAIFLYELVNISSGLVGELKKYVENGGVLVIIPAIPGNIDNYNSLLSSFQSSTFGAIDTVKIPLGEVMYENQLYAGVFKEGEKKVMLPTIKERYRFNDVQNVVETSLLLFADKSKALSVKSFGKGKTYIFSFPFSKSGNNFTEHILFMPTLYNMVLFSSSEQEIYYVLGKDRYLYVKNPFDKVLQNPVIKKMNTEKEYKPSNLQLNGNLLQISLDQGIEAGLYQVLFGNEVIGGAAINYDLKESDLACYTPEEIKTLVNQAGIKYFNLLNEKNGNFSGAVYELDHGLQYWKLFIYFALFFLLLEVAIIKFWDKFF